MNAEEYVVKQLMQTKDRNDFLEAKVSAMSETIKLMEEELDFLKSLWIHNEATETLSEHFETETVYKKWNADVFNRLQEILKP